MAPIRRYTNWNSGASDKMEKQEPYRKYFFICEGASYSLKFIDFANDKKNNPDIAFDKERDQIKMIHKIKTILHMN